MKRYEELELALLDHLNTTKEGLTASPIQQLIGRPTSQARNRGQPRLVGKAGPQWKTTAEM